MVLIWSHNPMRIGELSRQTGLSRDALRFYERNGLIVSSPSRDSTNTYREYDADNLDRIEMIEQAQAAGLSLADIKQVLTIGEASMDGRVDADAYLAMKIDEVETAIARARQFLKNLRETREALRIASKGTS